MVGDTNADIAAGRAAGCKTLLIRNPGSVNKRLQVVAPDVAADSLADGVQKLTGHVIRNIRAKPTSLW
jgi:phosphoglycolate phosphatase-like HAD superfamily hydrolase